MRQAGGSGPRRSPWKPRRIAARSKAPARTARPVKIGLQRKDSPSYPGGSFDRLRIISPKRNGSPPTGWDGFFPYYAGYPEGFAREIITSVALPPSAVVLDPWNGSGTTTYAASQLGLASQGFDLNPAMIAVARARLLPPSEADSIDPLAREISVHDPHTARLVGPDEPLSLWFEDATAAHLRTLEASIRKHLVGEMTRSPAGLRLDSLSGLAATFYVGLFAVARDLAAPFRTTNPTWLRAPKEKEKRVFAPRKLIVSKFLRALHGMAEALAARKKAPSGDQGQSSIALVDTTELALPPDSVDFVLTSPPYCTRIDYTAATRVELAVMAPLTHTVRKELSAKMIGTIRVPQRDVSVDDSWGLRCKAFLEAVRTHPSKASEIYYYRTHLDYFDKLARSLRHIGGALKNNGKAILVVQDSYYKEIHNPLPAIVEDIASHCGLTLQRREDFYLNHSMTGINPHTRAYRQSQSVVESVLCFKKE
jgi:DNA modification methylase